MDQHVTAKAFGFSVIRQLVTLNLQPVSTGAVMQARSTGTDSETGAILDDFGEVGLPWNRQQEDVGLS